MTGQLKVKVGGVWVPVPKTPGPAGPPGASAPAVAKQKARAFNGNLWNSNINLPASKVALRVQNMYLNDGFTWDGTGVLFPTAIAAGRFLVSAHLTIYAGVAGNWVIFGVERILASNYNILGTYEIVASNVTTAYRTMAVAATMDLNAGDAVRVTVNTDTAGAGVDGRSWLSISEVAW